MTAVSCAACSLQGANNQHLHLGQHAAGAHGLKAQGGGRCQAGDSGRGPGQLGLLILRLRRLLGCSQLRPQLLIPAMPAVSLALADPECSQHASLLVRDVRLQDHCDTGCVMGPQVVQARKATQ